MNRFNLKMKRNIIKSKILTIIIFVFINDIFLFEYFKNNLSEHISYTAKIKIEELTKYHLNDTIKKFLNVDTNNYIKVNLVNNNIVNVDIDNNKSNILLKNIINDIEKNIYDIEKGKISNYHNLEMLRGDNGIVIFMPIGVMLNNSLFSRLGPRIPIKVSFLENLSAYVDVEVSSYGINNSLIKLYININIEEIVELPIKKDRNVVSYKYLIASKLINGEVPSMLGGMLDNSSNIVNSSVK